MKTPGNAPAIKDTLFKRRENSSDRILIKDDLSEREIIRMMAFANANWGKMSAPRRTTTAQLQMFIDEIKEDLRNAREEIKGGVKYEDLKAGLKFSPLAIRSILGLLRMVAEWEVEKIGMRNNDVINDVKFQLPKALLSPKKKKISGPGQKRITK